MPVFTRRAQPPLRDSYKEYREEVREDFVRCCAYCLLPEELLGGQENFHLDHFDNRAAHPEQLDSYNNLYWACAACNRFKAAWPYPRDLAEGATIVDTVASSFEDHYQLGVESEWSGKTLAGKYTAKRLRLNSPNKLYWRQRLNKRAATMERDPVDWNRPSRPQILPLL